MLCWCEQELGWLCWRGGKILLCWRAIVSQSGIGGDVKNKTSWMNCLEINFIVIRYIGRFFSVHKVFSEHITVFAAHSRVLVIALAHGAGHRHIPAAA